MYLSGTARYIYSIFTPALFTPTLYIRLVSILLISCFLSTWGADTSALFAQETSEINAFIWFDTNRNTIFDLDAGETGIENVRVNLLDKDGSEIINPATTLPISTLTNSDGRYTFTAIPSGDYRVQIAPESFANGAPLAGYTSVSGETIRGGVSSGEFTLPPSDPRNVPSADIGLYQPLHLTSYVWHDGNGNGIIDTGSETGIEDVVVTLWDDKNNEITTTTTNNGSYIFEDLLAGEYQIEIAASQFRNGQTLDGYSSTAPANNGPTELQSDGLDGGMLMISPTNTVGVQFGLYRPIQIGNKVWFDYDADGIQSTLEPGVPNITVRLYLAELDATGVPLTETAIAETVTDAAGDYLFSDLSPGTYFVEFAVETLPEGYIITQPSTTSPLGDAVDSDADLQSGRTRVSQFLQSGAGSLNFDMGIHSLVSVGDIVWYDNDGDGVQDLLGEPGVPDVEMHLYYANTNQPVFSADGQTPRITTTNAAGEYFFGNLRPGNYFVKTNVATLPSGFQFSPHNVNDSTKAGDAVDSDFDPATGRSSETGFLLGNGSVTDSQDMNLDLGIFSPLSIGDMVWLDKNGDGIYNPGGINGVIGDEDDEVGIPDVLVTLYDTNSAAPVMIDGVARSTRTNSQGGYIFGNLAPGDYQVQFELDSLPFGHQVTLQNVTTAEYDSDADSITGRTEPTGPITIGQHRLDMDMGVWASVGIAGRAWIDDDGDGRRDIAENNLFQEAEIDTMQAHLHRSEDGQIILSTALDSRGHYTFTSAPPGNYYVSFDGLPVRYEATKQTTFGVSSAENSDVNPDTGRTKPTGSLSSTEWVTGLDIGIYKKTIISGVAWGDTNRDGIRGPGEEFVSGIRVQLYRRHPDHPELDEFVEAKTIDDSGIYAFVDLGPGSYYAVFDLATLPTDYVVSQPNARNREVYDGVDSDANPSTGRTASTGFIRSGVQQGGLDIGIHTLNGVRIGDTVWHDINANNKQDFYETGIPGVLMQLYASSDPNTVLATRVTDEDGVYLFDGLPSADYFVKIDPTSLPAAYQAVSPNRGDDDSIDSDFDPATYSTSPVGPLVANSQNVSLDAGLYQSASLGNRVWLDVDADGVQDVGEEGIANINATLYYGDGIPTGITTITDADGYYLFDNLRPGYYIIEYDLPNGYRFSQLNSGGAPGVDETDSDVNPETGRTTPIALYSGQQDRSFDAGIRVPLAISDLIWLDDNNNGQRDTDEMGIANVQLELYNNENEVVATTLSNSEGQYEFIDLTPGLYVINVIADNFAPEQPLANLYSSSDSTGSIDIGIDSANPTTNGIRSNSITLVLNNVGGAPNIIPNVPPTNMIASFGFYTPLSIGNRVWQDVNNDSQRDGAEIAGDAGSEEVESGIDGVTLHLYRDTNQDGVPDGAAIATRNTRDGGYYLFDNLGAGFYIVEVDAANFQTEGALANFANSWQGYPISAASLAVDNTDMGIDSQQWRSDGIRSATIALHPNNLPLDETDLGPQNSGIATNANSNLTVDFGFFRAYQIESRIWFDDNNSGGTDGGEIGVNDVLVELYMDADVNGQPDGSAIMTTTTYADFDQVVLDQVNGYFRFDGLPAGSYVVQVPAVNFAEMGLLNDRLNSTEDLDTIDVPGLVIDDGIAVINPYEIGVRTPTISLPRLVTAGADGEIQAASVRAIDDPGSDADFGFFESVEVGGQVWNDYNANGKVEVERSEVGIQGVLATLRRVDGEPPVDLIGSAVTPQTTDESGRYRFVNLSPGEYYVEFDLATLPSTKYLITAQDATGVDDSIDSDVDPETGLSNATEFLTSGQVDDSINMGIYAPINVGGIVWFDNSINGLHEPFDGELGVPDVIATLYSAITNTAVLVGGQPLTQTTDANGYYVFEGLPPGNYSIAFDLNSLPDAYRITLQNAFPDESADSDADLLTGQTDATGLLDVSDVSMDMDMGIFPLVAVGDRVWFDDNQDGQQNPDEMSVPGIRVTLYSTATNAPVPDPTNPETPWVQITDEDGRYLFSGLEDETAYYVEFDINSLPLGYEVTVPNSGGDASDSDADQTTGRTEPTELLQNGDVDLSVDMGIVAPSGVGDRVWFDLDADGLYEPDQGELGVPNVRVTLYSVKNGSTAGALPVPDPADPTKAWTLFTDPFGRYLFTGLPVGEYFVRFDLTSLPTDHQPSPQNVGLDDEIDSDADPATGQTRSTGPIFSGAQKLTLDMGVVGPVAVGSRVWFDDNRNGLQDDGEAGVPDVAVQIVAADGSPALDVSGNPVAATTTDATGEYSFNMLLPGAYFVDFNLNTLPAGYVVSKSNAGGNESKDSDANLSRGWTHSTIELRSGEADATLSMGIHQPFGVRVGDSVWHDLNANAIHEPGEPGIIGVTMELYVVDVAGNLTATGQTRISDASGHYLFDELPAGDYAIVFDLDTMPVDYAASGNRPDDLLSNPSNVNIFSGETVLTGLLDDHEQMLALDLGLYRPASLGDFAWLDRDADGTFDLGEPSLSNVRVTLLNADGTPTGRTDETDSAGRYLFENLIPGSYILEFLAPAGYSATSMNQGPNPSVDSDIDPRTRRTDLITVRSDSENVEWDAGFFLGGAFGNLVWLDTNANGIQESGEPGVSGVTVRLYSPLGIPVREAYTDLNGFYGFSGLADSEFFLEFIAKDDLIFTQSNQDTSGDEPSDKVDSDAVVDGSNLVGRTAARSAQAGINYSDWDAGMTHPASIGNYVWFDLNKDGVKGATESGVKGVEISLLDENENLVAITVSDEGGFYQFTQITPGRYRLSFDAPPSFQFTKRTEIAPSGLNSNLDSDVDPDTGQTAFFEVLPGQNDTVWGAGLISAPGAITLSSMNVTRRIIEEEGKEDGEELVVVWITSAELDTFGYHIRRGTNGVLDTTEQVTKVTIPSQGTTGGIYEFAFPYNAETDLPVGLLDFWLVELEVTDKQNIHGPVGVSVHPTHQTLSPEPIPDTEPEPVPDTEPEPTPDTAQIPDRDQVTDTSAVFLPAMAR